MALLDYINPFGKVIDSIGDAIDKNVTSDEERLTLKKEITALNNQITDKILEIELKRLEAQAAVLNTELKGESWLQRSWRPITMLCFVALIVSYWMGYSPPNLTQEDRGFIFEIIQWGLGGYIVSRGVEKTAKNWKKKDEQELPWLNNKKEV
jgi:hypothetical protein